MKTQSSLVAATSSSLQGLEQGGSDSSDNANKREQSLMPTVSFKCSRTGCPAPSRTNGKRRRSPRFHVSAEDNGDNPSSVSLASPTRREGEGFNENNAGKVVVTVTPDQGCDGFKQDKKKLKTIISPSVKLDFKTIQTESSTTDESATESSSREASFPSSMVLQPVEQKQSSRRTAPLRSKTITKTSLCNDTWILEDGLEHIKFSGLGEFVRRFGPPSFYTPYNKTNGCCNDNHETFRSLCRIIAGQQLSGTSATAVWNKLLKTVGASPSDPSNLTPTKIMSFANKDDSFIETNLRKPAGLSGAKVRYIIDLARHYVEGHLSDEILLSLTDNCEDIRERLLKVKGLGSWSCDMFLMFELHHSNILPLGDLGVRRGIAKFFNVKGKGSKGDLCMKKDAQLMSNLMRPFEPYRSLATYYMWKVVDTDLWI